MENKKKVLNKKGFTLVELIIVMAIMAILIGAIAPRLMQYVERSRESRDLQIVNSVHTALLTSIATYKGSENIPTSGSLETYTSLLTDADTQLGIGPSETADTVILNKCISKVAKDVAAGSKVLTITYDKDTQKLTVTIGGSTSPLSVSNN